MDYALRYWCFQLDGVLRQIPKLAVQLLGARAHANVV